MKNYNYLIAFLFVLSLVTVMTSGLTSPVHAQSVDGWTVPVNLSNSGSSFNPSLVIDSQGTIHAFWLDEFDGYKYVNSVDGLTWSEPKTAQVPFSKDPDKPVKPIFLAGPDETIHILWLDNAGALQYSRSTSATLGTPSSWTGDVTLTESSVKFDAVVDSRGVLHIGYINNLEDQDSPAGVYYRSMGGSGWSAPSLIYPSKYYRSLTPEDDANVKLATIDVNENVNVYIAWDDRSQKRIFLAKSLDEGKTWGDTFQVSGPEDLSSTEMPFNIDLGSFGEQILLLWQRGIPDGQCTQYSQWSINGSDEFSQPAKISDDLTQCPQSSEIIPINNDLSVLSLQMPNELSLIAWDGSTWSDLQAQNDASNFINPVTYANILLGCQNITHSKENLYLVGCDEGSGGDIWFTSRALGNVDGWFPPPSAWTSPSVLTSLDRDISSLTSVADDNNNIHAFWVQPPSSEESISKTTIQYSRWDGKSWSDPTAVVTGLDTDPLQLTTNVDGRGRISLAWVDSKTGELLFSWAGTERATRPSEWEDPQIIPSKSQANSSPDILTDNLGMMLVAYAVPINEHRGIYFVASSDAGKTWSSSYQVFDADSAAWDMVDQPRICLTGDGRLHALFSRYSLLGDQRRSIGLYYSQSTDGGTTWSVPDAVSEHPIQWSDIACSGQQTVHRIWQEENESYFVYLDQASQDGGLTWKDAGYITSLSEKITSGSLTSMGDGQLYFVQMVEDDNLAIQEWAWDGTLWNRLEGKELFIEGKSIPLAVTAGITTNGSFNVLVLTQNQDPASEPKTEIISLSRSLELPENHQSITAAIIPTPLAAGTESIFSDPGPTSTGTATFAEVGNPSSGTMNKNLLGLLLVGGILILFAIFILPGRKKGNQE